MRKSIMLAMSLLITFSVVHAQKPSGYNLKKGDRFTVTSVNDIKTTQEAMGQSIETSQVTTSIEELEVTAVEGGVYTIKATATRMKISISSPMMSQEMDSELSGSQNLPFKMMTGVSFSFKMNKKGEVKSLMGLSEMRSQINKAMAATEFADAAADLLSMYSDETIKTKLESQYGIYNPGNGTEWTKTTTAVATSIPIKFTSNFRWDDDKTILGEGVIDMDGSTNAAGMEMKLVMKGDQQVIIDLTPSTGFPSKIQSIQTLKGKMIAEGMEIPMTMVTEATTTVVKK